MHGLGRPGPFTWAGLTAQPKPKWAGYCASAQYQPTLHFAAERELFTFCMQVQGGAAGEKNDQGAGGYPGWRRSGSGGGGAAVAVVPAAVLLSLRFLLCCSFFFLFFSVFLPLLPLFSLLSLRLSLLVLSLLFWSLSFLFFFFFFGSLPLFL